MIIDNSKIKMEVEHTNLKKLKLKPMKCELNVLSKSDGSAILSQGETVTIASVNGPLDVKMTNQSIEKCTIEVLYSSKGGKTCIEDRYIENIIRQTCEVAILSNLHPRTGVNITVQQLEDYGGLLSCCINSVCLALINSGLAMKHAFASVACCVNEVGNVVLQPSVEGAQATMTFVFDSREKNLVTAFSEGIFSENAYKEALECCRLASEEVFNFYRSIVHRYSQVI